MMNEGELDDLDLQQRDILLNFSNITQITDLNLCRTILFQNQWNLEQAINNFIQGSNSTSSNTSPNILNNTTTSHNNNNNNMLTQRQTNNNNNNSSNFFDFLITPLRWLFRIYPESLNPDEDSINFINTFKAQYGEDGPRFCGNSYSQAVANANRETKFLLVYLHSPLHDDTPRFCR